MASWWILFLIVFVNRKSVLSQDSCLKGLTKTITSVNNTLQYHQEIRDTMKAHHPSHLMGHFHTEDALLAHFKVHSYYDGNLYLLSKYVAPAFYGSVICSLYGGYLAEPNDQLEWENLHRMAYKNRVQHVYVGMTDAVEDGKWLYSYSGTPVWWKFQKSENDGGTGENCASMSVFLNYYLADVDCKRSMQFFCEIPGYEKDKQINLALVA